MYRGIDGGKTGREPPDSAWKAIGVNGGIRQPAPWMFLPAGHQIKRR